MISPSQAMSAVRLFARNPEYFLRTAFERFRPALSYHFSRGGASSYPTTLIFFLTHKCNMRCKMCGLWGTHGTAAQALLPGDPMFFAHRQAGQPAYGQKTPLAPAEYGDIIRQVAFCRPTITLFGGEPLLYKDWAAVAQQVKAAKLHCRIVTNGLLLEKFAPQLVEIGVDKINVSIDGPPVIHESVRGVKGAFDKAIRGIQALEALKKARKVAAPIISAVCTISQANHAHLIDLAEALKDQPISTLAFQHLTFIDRPTYEEHDRIFSGFFRMSSEGCKGFVSAQDNLDPQVLMSQLRRLSHSTYRFPILFRPSFSLKEMADYYTNPCYTRRSHKQCVAPWREAYVMPDGSLTPCLDYVVGNLRTTPFRQLWNNAEFRRFREVLKRHGRFPFCHKCCN
jgi:MoaA/NifB/PqqE/SkfB family radical SAM enzyme